jgi:hypothetical protein
MASVTSMIAVSTSVPAARATAATLSGRSGLCPDSNSHTPDAA